MSLSSIFCTQLNCFKYFYVIPIFQIRHTVKEFQVLLFKLIDLFNITHSFAQLNGSKYCYVLLTIQLDSHLFTHC